MHLPVDVTDDIQKRLRRLEGQIRGLQRLVDEERDCQDIVTQLAAAKGALDRVGFRLMAAAMRYCETEPAAAREAGMDPDELERLFLKLS